VLWSAQKPLHLESKIV
jgi:excisionase family DNA binding protein